MCFFQLCLTLVLYTTLFAYFFTDVVGQDDDDGWENVDESDNNFTEPTAYTGRKQVNIPQNDPLTPMDALELIFDVGFFRRLKAETNRYARQCQTEVQRRKWSIVTMEELQKFFAIIIHMSLIHKPALKDYFSTNPVLFSSFPSQIGLGRDRFLSILKYLHINDNSTYIPRDQVNHDPLHKVRPLVDLLNAKFKELYTPSCNITLDEAMIPFRGRIAFKVYMKNKPNKYGIRLEVVADAENGIVLHFEAYTGAAGNQANTVDDLVLRMLEPFKDKNFLVFMDRRYSSPNLFTKLRQKGFYPVGTVMKSRRGLPKSFTRKLRKGQIINRRKGDMLALKWKDKRDVFLLTTADRAEMVETGQNRHAQAGGDHETLKPAGVVRYNLGKVGVDRADQMASYYPMHRKTVKWWKKVFFGLFTMALINLNKYMNMKNGSAMRLETFLLNIATHLGNAELSTPTIPGAAAEPRRHVEWAPHFPIKLEPTASKANPTRQCVHCTKKHDVNGKRIRRESSWKCKGCDVALCVGCFYPYHRPREASRQR